MVSVREKLTWLPWCVAYNAAAGAAGQLQWLDDPPAGARGLVYGALKDGHPVKDSRER